MFQGDLLNQLQKFSTQDLVQALERIHHGSLQENDGMYDVAPRGRQRLADLSGVASTKGDGEAKSSAPNVIFPKPPLARSSDAKTFISDEARDGAAAAPAVTRTTLLATLQSALTEYEGLLQRYNQDFDRVFALVQPNSASPLHEQELPTEDSTELAQRLARAQGLLFKFPIAAQALFASLVAEGKRFAQSGEGAELQAALANSELLRNVQTLLGSLSSGTLRESATATLPSALVDLIVQAASSPHLEVTLQQALGGKT